MKKLTLLLICIVGSFSLAHAQTTDDYITGQRGDTLVVKDFAAMDNSPNALADLIEIDTLAPPTRVYELSQGGYYFHNRTIASSGDRSLDIAGADHTPHVMSTNESRPATIVGIQVGDTDLNGGFFNFNTDITVRNIIGGAHSTSEAQGWTYFDANASGNTLTLDNVYMEHTNWVFIQSNDWPDNSIKISNSYFVNMNGNGCRRNGGVYDNVSNPTKEMWVENSTHVMGAGMIYKFRGFPVNKAVFNHNTFVNISNAPISTMGYQVDMAVTNNLFVNTNVQAYYPGLDVGETDQDLLPTGIINVDSLSATNNSVAETYLPEEYQSADASEWAGMRKILVDRNVAYWSPALDDVVTLMEEANATYLDTVANGPANGELMNSMITMNTRTQAMFDDDDTWPYLTEGDWLQTGLEDAAPGFTEDFGLMDESAALGNFKEWTVGSMPDDNAAVMTDLRTEGNPASGETYAISDWPIPVDLSYSNSAYLTGGLNGFPVGDVNWFPTQKAQWLAQRDAEYAEIEDAKTEGRPLATSIVENTPGVPTSIKLEQNYPNPFNPTTQISFALPQAQEISLKVYDMLGREVATLVNNEMVAGGVNNVTFDARNLASGVYMYVLRGENFSVSKTMTLMK
ncbi:MAG: hypothetical protein CL666_16730 [Balneola sp.]|nr:hypothetical protein [Balneola sp.]|tara:strand:- start:27133 stop:29013 length:1881 start_codon:yes stop_codon:yes gene_type:complete